MVNIVIIGPAYPYRGGIAHHTNNLANALLKQGNKVGIFTFSRQYPKVLYPGKAQFEPIGTENPFALAENFSINRTIDTLNPFSWYKTAQRIIKEKPDVCCIKYWHPYFALCFTFIVWLLRGRGISTVCIIDNLFPHERHRGDAFLIKLLLSQVAGVITQSEVVHEQFQKFLPSIPEVLIPHPVYDQFGPVVGMSEARQKLNIPSNKILLLFFGFIRPYKGLDLLLQVMPKIISQFPNVHLLIAGECFGSFQIYHNLIEKFNLRDYITLNLHYIESSEIPSYFGACDLLVMPYRSITNSGIENIAKVYTNKYLLTVGLGGDALAEKVIENLLDGKLRRVEGHTGWNNYAAEVIKFLE